MAKRYVTIDFLRGLAIWMMVFLHTLMRWVDQNTIESTLDTQELIIVIIFLAAVFFGSWCGFFLLVSSIGNMISMHSILERGQSWTQLAFRQVLSGFILLLFAYLSEGVIGYHGWIGENISHMSSDWTNYVDNLLSRGYTMEAIHAVAWCVIINGIVQALLSINGGYQKGTRNMIIYAILAVVVVAITTLAWSGVDLLVPGYPGAYNPKTGVELQRGYLGRSSFGELVYLFFLLPIAGQPEPLFPFLAVSFIGSIVGIWMTQKTIDRRFIRRSLLISLIMVFVGLIGTAIIVFSVSGAIDVFLGSFWNIRAMGLSGLWFWWFICLTGAQLGAVILVLRLVEFRGRAEIFSKQSTYWRRFGFVAFSIYTYEFVDMIAVLLLNLIPGLNMYTGVFNTYNKYQIWFIIAGTFLAWQFVLKLWEKGSYVFSLEWIIAKISEKLIPSKRTSKDLKLPWWKTPRLDVDAVLIHPEALNIISPEQVDHEHFEDSHLALKLAFAGLLFFPLAIASVIIAYEASKTEKPNAYLKKARILGGILTGIILIIFIASFFLTLSSLGLGGLL